MMRSRHPDISELQAWLESGETERIGRHVAGCDRCLVALDELTGLDDVIVADLARALEPPPDVGDRAAAQLERRLRNEDALMTFFDLFAAAWDTARTVFANEEEIDD
jgi:hypothetical protein